MKHLGVADQAIDMWFCEEIRAGCYQQDVGAFFIDRNPDGNTGVIFDVSYLTPDSIGYTMPIYWRFTIWGTDGALEAGFNTPQMTLFKTGEDSPRSIDLPVGKPGAYLDSFLHEIGGETDLHLSSADVMKASRISLQLQEIADRAK